MLSTVSKYTAIISYNYDGERNDMYHSVQATSMEAARKQALEDAREMLEEGIRARITEIWEVIPGALRACYALPEDKDNDDDEDASQEFVDEQETETGWVLTRKDGSRVEIHGDWTSGTWIGPRSKGTYEAFTDYKDRAMMRFREEDGSVLDIVEADEECWAQASLF
jgi:hypothetical protein